MFHPSRLTPALGALAAALALAAPATAQPRPVLTVHTYSSFVSEYGPGALIEERFEAVCGCDLVWVTATDAAELLARLRLDGTRSTADVILGLDTNLTEEARATGLFAPHGLDLPPLDLPVEWTDATFVPFDWSWFAFVYDRRRLPNPPASLAELIDAPGSRPSVIIEDPRTSSPGLGLLTWIKDIYGDGARAAWSRLAPQIVTVTQGWSEAYGLFVEGEADMVLSYTTSPAYHLIAEDDPNYAAAVFSEGHAMQVEVSAMVASTDVPELARLFLDFTLSEAFQSAIPTGNWMFPARLPAEALPAEFAALPRPATTLMPDGAAVAAGRRAWTDEWLAALR